MLIDVSQICTKEDLKKTYKKLCLIYHPDVGGSKEKFLLLQKEYDLLMNNPSLFVKEKPKVKIQENPKGLKFYRTFKDHFGKIDISLPKAAFDEGCVVFLMDNNTGAEVRAVMPKSGGKDLMIAKVKVGNRYLEILAHKEKY